MNLALIRGLFIPAYEPLIQVSLERACISSMVKVLHVQRLKKETNEFVWLAWVDI